jgi:GNAT superfamily N-acetyltransferase
MTGDPRVAMVEQHYVNLFHRVDSPSMRRLPDEDVLLYVSDLPLPIFSGAIAAQFEPGAEARRTGEVLDVLFANGAPFQWWSGPLSHHPEVTDIVQSRGLVSGGSAPGMHADLSTVTLPEPDPRVVVERCEAPEEVLEANEVFVAAFGIPTVFAQTFLDVWGAVPDGIQLVARIDGVAVGAAAGIAIDGVMGVYNVGTLETARRQGVGRALTAELMRAGREQACHSSILHSSDLGYPVYQALGFEHVTDVHQHVWLPAD